MKGKPMNNLSLDLSLKQLENLQKDVDKCFKDYVEGKAKKGRRRLDDPTTDQPAGRIVEVDTGGDPLVLLLVGLAYIPAEKAHVGAEPGPLDTPGYPHDCEWDRLYFAVKPGLETWWYEANFGLSEDAEAQITEQLSDEEADARQRAEDDEAESEWTRRKEMRL
jgi:hypothetical protein